VYLLIINPKREISTTNQKKLLAFAKEAAKSVRTEKDLCGLSPMLKKLTVEPGAYTAIDYLKTRPPLSIFFGCTVLIFVTKNMAILINKYGH
jgi:hypothetical protein